MSEVKTWELTVLPEYEELFTAFLLAKQVHTKALIRGTIVEVFRENTVGTFRVTLYAGSVPVRVYNVWPVALASILEAVYAKMGLLDIDRIVKETF